MNYLAHASLAEPTDEARLGSLLGDFSKGLVVEALPENMRFALEEHRAVDRWFDDLAEVRAAKDLFPRELRRFSGILIDVFVDHFLVREWEQLGPEPIEGVTASLYRSFDTYAYLLPPRLARTAPSISTHDWLGGYGDVTNIRRALAGIESRMRRSTGIERGIDVLEGRREELRALALTVFPKTRAWVLERRAALGRPPA